MTILAKHAVTYSAEGENHTFYFLAPPDHYAGIEIECGVSKLVEDSELQDMPVTNTDELALSPVCSRKRLRVKVGTKNKYVPILIASAKLTTVDSDLTGKSYKGGEITRVLDPRKATRY